MVIVMVRKAVAVAVAVAVALRGVGLIVVAGGGVCSWMPHDRFNRQVMNQGRGRGRGRGRGVKNSRIFKLKQIKNIETISFKIIKFIY